MKEKILEEYEKGNIVFAGLDIQVANIDEFINQPTEGILYDLNRTESVVLSFSDDQKWINDFAVCKVIRALKEKIEKLENK